MGDTITPLSKQEESTLIAKLIAENAELKAKAAKRGRITLKVGEKRGLCVYGLQVRPVTLYAGQWERLLQPEIVKQIQDFLVEHHDELSHKD